MPGHVGLETYTFEEAAGQTTLTATSVFNTLEERDGVIASGMEAGANESADRLEELLASLQAGPAACKQKTPGAQPGVFFVVLAGCAQPPASTARCNCSK